MTHFWIFLIAITSRDFVESILVGKLGLKLKSVNCVDPTCQLGEEPICVRELSSREGAFSIVSGCMVKKVLACQEGDVNVILHLFPHPIKDAERFEIWKRTISRHLLSLDNQTIFKLRRVCHLHFERQYHTWAKRLSHHAVPTLNISDRVYEVLKDGCHQLVKAFTTGTSSQDVVYQTQPMGKTIRPLTINNLESTTPNFNHRKYKHHHISAKKAHVGSDKNGVLGGKYDKALTRGAASGVLADCEDSKSKYLRDSRISCDDRPCRIYVEPFCLKVQMKSGSQCVSKYVMIETCEMKRHYMCSGRKVREVSMSRCEKKQQLTSNYRSAESLNTNFQLTYLPASIDSNESDVKARLYDPNAPVKARSNTSANVGSNASGNVGSNVGSNASGNVGSNASGNVASNASAIFDPNAYLNATTKDKVTDSDGDTVEEVTEPPTTLETQDTTFYQMTLYPLLTTVINFTEIVCDEKDDCMEEIEPFCIRLLGHKEHFINISPYVLIQSCDVKKMLFCDKSIEFAILPERNCIMANMNAQDQLKMISDDDLRNSSEKDVVPEYNDSDVNYDKLKETIATPEALK